MVEKISSRNVGVKFIKERNKGGRELKERKEVWTSQEGRSYNLIKTFLKDPGLYQHILRVLTFNLCHELTSIEAVASEFCPKGIYKQIIFRILRETAVL